MVFFTFLGLVLVLTVLDETEGVEVEGLEVDLGPGPILGHPLVHTPGPTLGLDLAQSLHVIDHAPDHLALVLPLGEQFVDRFLYCTDYCDYYGGRGC